MPLPTFELCRRYPGLGIYDREYYRREGPSLFAHFSERGYMCKWLIAVNIVCFVLQMGTQQNEVVRDDEGNVEAVRTGLFTEALQLDADAVMHGQIWRLLSYAFLHDTGNFWHIFFNMLLLFWFGSDVEDLYGSKEFLVFYLVSAVLGGIAFVLTWAAGLPGSLCVGASGAVTAVLVVCALHYPTRIILLFFFLPVPIWLFVIFNVGQDFLKFITQTGGRTAVIVHLAGAAFGFLYHQNQWRLTKLLPAFHSWQRQRSRPRLRVYQEERRQPVSVGGPPPAADEHLEAEMDRVLEKVKNSGLNSLTDGERQILVRASEVIKKRRT